MGPEWENITFQPPPMLKPRASVSWAKSIGGHNRNTFNINLSKSLVALMGWSKTTKLLVFATGDRSIMSITPGKNGRSLRMKKHGSGTLPLAMPHIRIAETIEAQEVSHKIVGNAVHISVPDWALLGQVKPAAPAPKPYVGIMSRTVDPAAVARGKR